MTLLQYFIGEAKITLTGAAIETFLNAMTKHRVEFWRLERNDELHFSICVAPKDIKKTQQIAISGFCNVEAVKTSGFQASFHRLVKRPALLLGMALVIFFSFYCQAFVLAIEISGNEALHEEDILRALAQHDIHIGAASDIDQQLTKHRMLGTLPELSWIGVNRSGFLLNVLVTERSFSRSNRPAYHFANVVSAKDATITRQNVFQGMKLSDVGDSVKRGQTLVSGFEDYGLILRGVCAEAEIYGQTWYTGVVATPAKTSEKRYTGRSWTKYSLIIGRKRIYFFGNSSILGARCDKMIEEFSLSVPKYEFPIRLEKITYREYEQAEVSLNQLTAQERLQSAWREQLLSQMIAGTIDETECTLKQNGELFSLHCQSTCNEMIGRLVPMEPVYEGEHNE